MTHIAEFDEFINEGKNTTEITSKDTMRVTDIIKKAGGAWNAKALQLTKQMANAITDAIKAYRRGEAAEEEGERAMAHIFYLRAGELGFKL